MDRWGTLFIVPLVAAMNPCTKRDRVRENVAYSTALICLRIIVAQVKADCVTHAYRHFYKYRVQTHVTVACLQET